MPIIKKHIKPSPVRNLKNDQLLNHTSINDDKTLTTNQGLKINEYQNSTKDGARGPTLLEDIILREKITHSDHEKIPERIVHARGSAAHGTFQARNNPALFFNFH